METKVIRVSRALLDRIKDGPVAAKTNGQPQVRCVWCYTPRLNRKKPCEVCGYQGVTELEEKNMSRVYVEEVDD
jgi:hypothetical protein